VGDGAVSAAAADDYDEYEKTPRGRRRDDDASH
jgi:hypothetical protein